MVSERSRTRISITYAVLALLLVVLILGNILMGSSSVSAGEAVRILFSHDTATKFGKIVWDIRMPRIAAALFLGGALAVSGFLLQTFFANPIAGPYILGISSGAKFCVAVAMIFAMSRGLMTSSFMMIIAAFAGSVAVTAVILLISRRIRSMAVLIVCGVMVGYICSAITEFLVTFADDSNIVNLHNWSMGSFSAVSWDNVRTLTIAVVIGVAAAFMLSKPMTAFQMGEQYARSVGVNIRSFRIGLITLSSLLSATVTAFAGPISFVGIAVPHLIRSITGTSKPIVMVPQCFLGGAVFCLFCDLLARNLFAPTEMSISTMTAVFGAPVVIFMLLDRKARR
ncbi:MAG: iron ABC transporter permease [Mogibacterium sp.]|nr:iron ABC transporter permease [Mogibacterium sp.]